MRPQPYDCEEKTRGERVVLEILFYDGNQVDDAYEI